MSRSSHIQLPTRRSLISRLRNRQDDDSWRDFFQTYWKLIYSFAIRSGCTDAEAEDVVQETVIALANKMPEYRYDPATCSFKGWLLHITNYRVIDQLRKRRRGTLEPLPADEGSERILALGSPVGSELELLWDREWEKNLMDAAMERVKRRINAEHYQIFHLLMVKRESPAKVADLLKVSKARLALVKHRVAKLVRKEIEQLKQRPM